MAVGLSEIDHDVEITKLGRSKLTYRNCCMNISLYNKHFFKEENPQILFYLKIFPNLEPKLPNFVMFLEKFDLQIVYHPSYMLILVK